MTVYIMSCGACLKLYLLILRPAEDQIMFYYVGYVNLATKRL